LTEKHFGIEFTLAFEWTGLNCWHKGSMIHPHYDSNRDYLKQRHFSAILYLNSNIDGGNFHFVDKNNNIVESIVPKEGNLLMFSSGSENSHKVDEILSGFRYTLTIWFTTDPSFSEDEKYVQYLCSQWNPIIKENLSWDLLSEKLEYFGLVPFGNFGENSKPVMVLCSGILIPYPFDDIKEAIQLASFCEWKAGIGMDKLVNRMTIDGMDDFGRMVYQWKRHCADMLQKCSTEMEKWRQMGLFC